ncbi:hypothetical protein PGTUg99_005958 [Puccinia graminis f. sp. tritici]|uniref:PAC domain-containing protein n=1 Tax=Puccinia graminis f. sp. tritici TaxID=56615 RepID=A0A5B0PPM9_PUCGR|nr:hypothetical protein PGTUg99_005958 [Puccinia graminis f. sp. tritici]
MSSHQSPINTKIQCDISVRQVTSACPLAPGLTKGQSNDMAPRFCPRSNQGRIQVYQKAGCQDARIIAASSSSEAGSQDASNTVQKKPRIVCGDYPTACSPVPSIVSLPLTLSDCESDDDDGSNTEHVPHRPAIPPAKLSFPKQPTGRVEFPNQPSRIFDSQTDQMEQSAYLPRATKLDSCTSTQATVTTDTPLEEMYGKELTSYPQQTVIEEEMKASLLSLLSIESFTYMLSKPKTRNVFRDWLVIQGGVEKLDRWTEESRINQLHIEAQENAKKVLHHYHESDGKRSTRTSLIARLDGEAIKETVNLAHSSQVLVASRQYLLESLYNDTFKQFITSKLLEITKMKLCSGVDEETCQGLGDSFCVTNPRLRDNPVVMVSLSFSATTGHDRHLIIGKNCRFLQGPGTSPQSIQRLRQALKQGLPSVELLLNYKADGTPFYCLLSIIPLFDEKGFLSYYIGGQINVTDELRNNQLMALISQTNAPPEKITSADFELPAGAPANHAKFEKLAAINPRLLDKLSSSNDTHDSKDTLGSKPKSSTSFPFNWFSSKIKQEKIMQDIEFTKPDDRSEFNGSTLHESLSAFQSTYSRLILFKKASRSIVFITPEALDFLGFPTETIEEAYSSALLHHDFFDLVENCKTTRNTPCSKKLLKKIISKDASASFQCELCWSYTLDDQNTRILFKQRKKVQVIEPSVIHLTPLIDQTGSCSSYVAVLS